MDLSSLPAPTILKIFEYLPLEVCLRIGRVNKMFRQISQLAISRATKSLNLVQDRFRKLIPDQLALILDLCSSNLQGIKFGKDYPEFGEDRFQKLATTFSNFECPRLIDLNLGETPIDRSVFHQLIRNCPNMESLEWHKEFVGFPTITANYNLKKLCLKVCSNVSLQTLIGRCPNLEEIDFEYDYTSIISAEILDQLFASAPRVQRIEMDLATVKPTQSLVNFWNLPLLSLTICFVDEYILHMVSSSFPRLQELHLYQLAPTNQGIASLAALQELQVLKLGLITCRQYGDEYDQGIQQLAHCQNLRKLNVVQSKMTSGTLVNLIRSCSQLEYLQVQNITQVDTAEEAVIILLSLAGIPNRDITIHFGWRTKTFESIWRGETVEAAIKMLEEDEGLKIKIVG